MAEVGGKKIKVAYVVKIKLLFYGLTLLLFDNINKTMQNPIQKFRQSYNSIFFAETLQIFPTYQWVQKRVWDFFYFV